MEGSALIIEDHPMYRDALVVLASGLFGSNKTFSASSVEDAMSMTGTLPDLRLVLIDMGLPGVRGVEAICTLRRALKDTPMIAVSASNERREVEAALKFGVKAFVSKSVLPGVLLDVIKRVLAGDTTAPEWVTSSPPAAKERKIPGLTPRQMDILPLLGDGLCNKEIGLRLGISETRVKQHISVMFRALGVSNRTQVVLAARQLGLSQEASSFLDGERQACAKASLPPPLFTFG